MASYLPCLICGSDAKMTLSLTSGDIRTALEAHFVENVSPEVIIDDYAMFRCEKCGAEFADPRMPGSDTFYHWITQRPGYYLNGRWEFSKAAQLIRERSQATIDVLDVGCGSGDFLDFLRNEPSVKASGLDMTRASVDKCHERGLTAYCSDMESFACDNPSLRYDIIVSFHVVEHVADPASFLQDMQNLLKDDGSLLISAPLSPMSYEDSWFDILNYPPHHLTRFSLESLRFLADRVNLSVKIHTSEAPSRLRRAARASVLRKFGPGRPVSKLEQVSAILGDAPAIAKAAFEPSKRPKHMDKEAGDTFLAEFHRRS